jgi:hypothetical protein
VSPRDSILKACREASDVRLADEEAEERFTSILAQVERDWIGDIITPEVRLCEREIVLDHRDRRELRAHLQHASTGRHAADLRAVFATLDAAVDAWHTAINTWRVHAFASGAWLEAGIVAPDVAKALDEAGIAASDPLLREELHAGATWAHALCVTREVTVADFAGFVYS